MLKSKGLIFSIFLILNFAALFVGALLMGNPATNEWYLSLEKAPWTPQGWVFGAAWTMIMILFSFFMMHWYLISSNKKRVMGLYILHWVLNVSWNPLFFVHHYVVFSGIVIVLLTLLIAFFTWIGFTSSKKWIGIFVLPYLFWLFIATSLNWYVV